MVSLIDVNPSLVRFIILCLKMLILSSFNAFLSVQCRDRMVMGAILITDATFIYVVQFRCVWFNALDAADDLQIL